MADLVIQEEKIIERILTLELVRVTERAAVASARLRGRGDEKAADQAAVDAMRRELNRLPIDGTVGQDFRDHRFRRRGETGSLIWHSQHSPERRGPPDV